MMIGMQYNSNNLRAKGGFASSILAASAYPEANCKRDGIFTINEPISVLDTRSPSPSTSTSTFSSFNNPQGTIAVSEPTSAGGGGVGKKEWVAEMQPPGVSENGSLGVEDWEGFSESAGKQTEILKLLLQGGNQNEIQGIMGLAAIDKSSEFTGNVLCSYNPSALGLSGSGFSLNDHKEKLGLDSNNLLINNNGESFQSLAPYTAFPDETLEQKVEVFNPLSSILVPKAATYLNPLLFGAQNQLPPVVKHEILPIKQQHLPQMLDPRMDLFQQKQVLYDEVHKAAELIQAGNFSNAQGILARLNHFLAPIGKPFLRSAFYVKEALELAFIIASIPPRIPSPVDGMFKMGAYKLYSEVSPLIQFMNFTANQLILEALGDSEHIHIIDFDIGFGAHWSSFLQELPRKNRGVTSVKITAFASPSTHHSLEITLMHENLTQFANELGINFELEVVNIDSFDPNCNLVSSLRSSESETIAVNFPIWSFMSYLSALPSYLCLIKKLQPKILVSLGQGCERTDLPFSHHILHTLQYYEALLDSIDAADVTSDASNKIEKLLLQPRIESTVLGRLLFPSTMPPWRNLFASMGYFPVSMSDLAKTQAECLLQRMQVRGFRVERQQSSLLLYWQRCELLSVSAWRC